MAFDRFVTFKTRDPGLVVLHNGITYTQIQSWGEAVLSPVVTSGFSLEGQTVILVPYNPILIDGRIVRESDHGDVIGVGFQQIEIDGIVFLIDSIQARDGRRHLEVIGSDPTLVGEE